MIEKFPPHETASVEGLLAVGGDLEPESLLLAYRNGIFPWPILGNDVLAWFSPPLRALLFFEDFSISRSLKKLIKNNPYRISFNSCFDEVIRQCAISSHRGNQVGTWITPEMIEAYRLLHRVGYAHSVECFNGTELVGGLYGVSIGGMFAGESMFYLEPNTSKLCLCHLIDHLSSQGLEWIDCQQLTPLFRNFGAKHVPRAQFLNLLSRATNSPPVKF